MSPGMGMHTVQILIGWPGIPQAVYPQASLAKLPLTCRRHAVSRDDCGVMPQRGLLCKCHTSRGVCLYREVWRVPLCCWRASALKLYPYLPQYTYHSFGLKCVGVKTNALKEANQDINGCLQLVRTSRCHQSIVGIEDCQEASNQNAIS